MRQAIADAVVGAARELEQRAAALLGQDEAVFLPTATMANQIALRVLTEPGHELLAEENSHVMVYESGGPAVHSGLVMRGLPGGGGRVAHAQIRDAVRYDEDLHFSAPRVVSLENTHNASGGRVWPLEDLL